MRFKNPVNEYTLKFSTPIEFITCFVFGPIYFAYRGLWGHVFASMALAIVTHGLSWMVYPFAVQAIIQKHYLKKGWVAVNA